MVREHFLDGKIATIAASHRNDASSTGARRSKGRFRDEDGEDWEDSGVFFRCVIIDSNYCILLTLFFSRSSFSYSREFNTVTSPRTKESSSRSTPYCPYFLSG